MSPDFIYTMKDLRKVVPPKREILKGIWLSFFYGAKIGVLGLNGAGKSSLLRIMAGVDPDFIGEAAPGQGLHRRPARAGAAARPGQERAGEHPGGRGRQDGRAAPLERDQRAASPSRWTTTRWRSCSRSRPRSRTRSTPRNAWDLDRHARDRHGRAALPAAATRTSPRSPAASGAAWRCAACCCRSPTCCCSTSPPTTSTPSRWPGWSASSRSTRARWSRSPTTATSSTTWPAGSSSWTAAHGIPWKGNYSSWLEQKQQAPGGRGEAGERAAAHARARAGVGAHGPAGAAGQEQGAHRRPTRSCWPRRAARSVGEHRDLHPPRAAAGRPW